MRERKRKISRAKQGTGPPVEPRLISAEASRRHINYLREHGIGYRAIEQKTGFARSNLLKIATGQQKSVIRSTEKKILEITADSYSKDHTVPSDYAKEVAQEIFDAGYTLRQINELLGNKMPHQKLVTGKRIRLKQERKIEALHFHLLRRPIKAEKPKGSRRKGYYAI